jgi:predicted short-subunit dehydrogenase-like oxidoreductase (DUF2520 family)
MIKYNISFAGAGRVAGAVCKEIFNAGYKIQRIVSESDGSGGELANYCGAAWSGELVFPESTDIIIVAVPDHRLKGVLNSIECSRQTLVAHTAGSMGLDIFPEQLMHKAVFYPLQTFSKERKVNFRDLPWLLESSDSESSAKMKELAESIGGKTYFVDTEHRRMLHLAAVFVSNFTNYMLTAGKKVTIEAGLPFNMLEPLIIETISKAIDIGPENSQTGPAVRNDLNTIEKHMELLSFSPDLKHIYEELTNSIIKHHNK